MMVSLRNGFQPWTRMALIAAALIAIAAIGIAFLGRKQSSLQPAAVNGTGQTPDVGDMIAKLEARLKEDPSSSKGWQMLGWSYFETGRYADAADAYKKATELRPKQAELWSALGESLVMAGRASVSQDALTAFAKAVAIDPGDPRARFFMGAAKAERGDPKGAVEDWITLLKDSPPGAP